MRHGLQVRLVDDEDLRTDVLDEILALEKPGRLIDGDTALDDHGIGRRRGDEAALDPVVDAGRHVEGEKADLVDETALAQQVRSRLRQ